MCKTSKINLRFNANRSLKQVKSLFLGLHKTYNQTLLVPSTTQQKKHCIIYSKNGLFYHPQK